tara:strand:+ start:3327 stop:3509 length:183 start_codon:yes stop_codon:yes gene_type:complete
MRDLPTEVAEDFARELYKSLCLNVILSAYGDSKDSLYNKEIMERVIELIKIPDFDEKNVN